MYRDQLHWTAPLESWLQRSRTKMDTLNSIKTFRQVVESGSFVAAAERLDMSTAAVSKHVMHVEERLGVRLLNRNSRSLSLTEPGRLYFERCKTILEELQSTELELGALGRVARGTLRVSVPSAISGQWLADFLAEYRHRFPEVLVDLSFEDRFVNLVDEGYDLALRIASNPEALPAGLIARSLRPAKLCLAASREYVKDRGQPKTATDLSHHDFVTVGSMSSLSLLGPNGRIHIPLHVVLRHRSMGEVANAVAAGIGIGAVSTLIFEHRAFKQLLVPILPECPVREAMLYVVYASRRLVPLKIRTFVDFIIESLGTSASPQHIRAVEATS